MYQTPSNSREVKTLMDEMLQRFQRSVLQSVAQHVKFNLCSIYSKLALDWITDNDARVVIGLQRKANWINHIIITEGKQSYGNCDSVHPSQLHLGVCCADSKIATVMAPRMEAEYGST